MAGATAKNVIGLAMVTKVISHGNMEADRAQLAKELGVSVGECWFDVNVWNSGYSPGGAPTISARLRTAVDSRQDFADHQYEYDDFWRPCDD